MNGKAIPTVSTRLRIGDRLGHWRVRWAIGRMHYSVKPGLYKVGAPNPGSPVLVTANYKLTFDVLRAELQGLDAWLLVLDTKGINVWCAAGKRTFGTEELVKRIHNERLGEIVSHRKLIVPQLGATGVAAHEVRRMCGFKVIYGPVRASDLKAFLEDGMRATNDMRRVTFTLGERLVLVGAELGIVLQWLTLLTLVMLLLDRVAALPQDLEAILHTGAPIVAGILAGTVIAPILLPWIPGPAFSLKGAVAGAFLVGATLVLLPGSHTPPYMIRIFLLGTAVASFLAMQFTGSTTFTSPSGVEWEMRRALPFQIGAVVIALTVGLVL
jgi:hypothetical protein